MARHNCGFYLNIRMLSKAHVNCKTQEEFNKAIEEAIAICVALDQPVRVMGHCNPTTVKHGEKPGNGHGGIMFSALQGEENIHHVYGEFLIEDAVFDISEYAQNTLRNAGKLVGYSSWHDATHVLTLRWHGNDWEYGMVGSDRDAILNMLKYNGAKLRRVMARE